MQNAREALYTICGAAALKGSRSFGYILCRRPSRKHNSVATIILPLLRILGTGKVPVHSI